MSNYYNYSSTDIFSIVKSQNEANSKDIIISELNKKITKLSEEINRLCLENSNLKKMYSINYDVQKQLKSAVIMDYIKSIVKS